MTDLLTGLETRQHAQLFAENSAFRTALASIARSLPSQVTAPWCQKVAKDVLDRFEEVPAVVEYQKPTQEQINRATAGQPASPRLSAVQPDPFNAMGEG